MGQVMSLKKGGKREKGVNKNGKRIPGKTTQSKKDGGLKANNKEVQNGVESTTA